MRVLHVIRSLDPRCGGPPTVVRNLVREQIHRGHEVTLLSTSVQAMGIWKPASEFREEVLADSALRGAEVRLLRGFGRRGPWMALAYAPQARPWLRRRLADQARRPDVVHLHGVFAHVFTVAAAEARRRAIPYLIEPYGCLDSGTFRTGRHRLKRAFVRCFLRRDLSCAAAVQVASSVEADELGRWLPADRIRVIPHGVDLPTCDPAEARQAFLAEFPRLRGRRIVLCVARLDPIKRLPILVQALAKVRRDCPDLVLVIAGKDSGGLEAVEQVAGELGVTDAVVLAGFLEGRLKEGAFAAADLFALPSLHENFGIVVVEAMAHGLPVAVTPEVASHVLVDACGGGKTVEGTPEAFAQAVQALLAPEARALGERGQRYVQEHLSWTRVADQIDSLYRDALAARRDYHSIGCP